jgi:hypothetical protein
MRINAHLCATEELPSALRKPFCELDLHRRIRSFFPVPRGLQPGWDGYRQGIDIKRLAHRRQLAESTRASPQNYAPMHKRFSTRGCEKDAKSLNSRNAHVKIETKMGVC